MQTTTNTGIKSDSVSAKVEIADIEKPVFNRTAAPWGTAISFMKSFQHRYKLEDDKSGLVTCKECGDNSQSEVQIEAIYPVTDVIIIVSRDGYQKEIKSEKIEFTEQAGVAVKPNLSSTSEVWGKPITFIAKDNYIYTLQGNTTGVNLDTKTQQGIITATQGAKGLTIVATRKADNKYFKASTASDTFEFKKKVRVANKPPILSSTSEVWGGKQITFTVEKDYEYTLQGNTTGVNFDANNGIITATQGAKGLTIVATRKADNKYLAASATSGTFTFTKQTKTPSSPTFSSKTAAWGTEITFTRQRNHAYTLKNKNPNGSKYSATLNLTSTTGKITADGPVNNVVVRVTRNEDAQYKTKTIDSASVSFTKQTKAPSPPKFSPQTAEWGTTITFTPQRNHSYILKNSNPNGSKYSATLDSKQGKITADGLVNNVVITITRHEDARYKTASVSATVNFKKKTNAAIKPNFNT